MLALDYNEDIVRSKIKNCLVVDGRFDDVRLFLALIHCEAI